MVALVARETNATQNNTSPPFFFVQVKTHEYHKAPPCFLEALFMRHIPSLSTTADVVPNCFRGNRKNCW
jgi:hypothetical protein